jgi:phosphoribosylformylglycinamidine synthase
VDLDHEVALQTFCRRAIAERLISSCHDVSDGGLAVALAECGLLAEPHLGLSVTLPWEGPAADVLFGEGQGRVIASICPENLPRMEALSQETEVPLLVLGEVVEDRVEVRVSDRLSPAQVVVDIAIRDLWESWRFGLERGLGAA